VHIFVGAGCGQIFDERVEPTVLTFFNFIIFEGIMINKLLKNKIFRPKFADAKEHKSISAYD